jgi:hypothetical protein
MRRLAVILSLWTLAALAGAGPAFAVDLLTQANIRLDGAAAGDKIGLSVAGAGDVNGDGLADVIVAAAEAGNNGSWSGSAYVVFGRGTTSTVDLGALGTAGFQIDGGAAGDLAGNSVDGAGDVNGDGLADVVVGAPLAGNNSRTESGSAYVVFGKTTSGTVDLGALGAGGFRIDGARANDRVGISVAGATDVNGDGRADVVVGAPFARNSAGSYSGAAFVVFGRTTTSTVDLATLGADGFRIDGAAAGDDAGRSVDAAGDVNGDGRADVIVGADEAGSNGLEESGSAYVVFGTTTTTTVDLAALGGGGYRIDGLYVGSYAGGSVAGAGDVNGDGRADVIVGTSLGSNNGRNWSGSAYVVFGKTTTSTVDLAALGAGGFRIDGAAAGDEAGEAVAGAGDANGDGLADVIVGATGAGNNGRTWSGSAYVVYGRTTTSPVDLAALGGGGYRIDGASAGEFAGTSVAGAGDVNGDGAPDVIVGAYRADNNGRTDSGSAYVVFGVRPLWGYVWANDATSASSTPSVTYQKSSAGAVDTMVRTGTGAYTLTFPNLGVNAGTVNVTAYGTGSEMCKVKSWLAGAGGLAVRVLCFTAAGAPVDTQFTATFAKPVGGSRWAYVWANLPAAGSYTPHTTYQGNATGATNTITRLSTGRYEVRLPGVGGPSGAAKVTAYGSGSEACKVDGWSQSGSDELVTVQCTTAAGVATDAQFTMTFHAEGGVLGVPTRWTAGRAHVLADQPASASYTPGPDLQFNSTGGTNTITRSSTGVYTVFLPGLWSRRGDVQVTAYADAARCKVASWGGPFFAANVSVGVRCFDNAGAPADARFVMSFVE